MPLPATPLLLPERQRERQRGAYVTPHTRLRRRFRIA